MRFRRLAISVIALLALALCPDHGNAQLRKAPDTPKSPTVAGNLSAFPTIGCMILGGMLIGIAQENNPSQNNLDEIGFGIWAAGVTIGPSLGYFYANDPSRAQTGIAIRSGTIIASIFLFEMSKSQDSRKQSAAITRMLAFGLRLTAPVSAIYDILNFKKSVEKYNCRHGLARIQLTPIYLANQRAPGLGLRVTL